MIKDKCLAGKTSSGKPIVYVCTHGGLHAVFAKNDDGKLEAIATAPHKAIMAWMAEQKLKGLVWQDDFLSKGEDDQVDRFRHVRGMVWAGLRKAEPSGRDEYLVYDVAGETISVMDGIEVERGRRAGTVPDHAVLRRTDLTDAPCVACQHERFGAAS